MEKIIIATNNTHKAKEIQELAPQYKWVTLKDLDFKEEIIESGKTFEENALIKAQYIAEKFNTNCIADDSGLCVEVLNGAPGVYSARYSGEKATDEENNKKLLIELEGITNRKASFVCVICLFDIRQNKPIFFKGEIKGNILKEKQGENGFGYDPLFKSEYHTKSFAEISMDEKNKVSHRAQAIQQLVQYLKNH